MNEPTFDRDGYPTDETLERIRTWDIQTFADCGAAMDFAGRAWSYPNYWKCQPRWRPRSKAWHHKVVRRYVFSTGGWSGNESIVAAIEENSMLRALGAWTWRVGGHYEYRFPVDA